MKRKIGKLLLIIIILVNGVFMIPINTVQAMTTSQSNFISSIKSASIDGYKKYNILPSLTIAQAILESGWGQSQLSTQANNLFGIKAYSDWNGATVTMATKEYVNGNYITINAKFKAYSSWSDSIKDHNELLATQRYSKVRQASNYKEACYAVQECGYATAPDYATALINMIESYNISAIDEECKTSQYPICVELFVTREAQYRKGPGENYDVVGTWSKGAAITAIDQTDGWWQTRVGWIKKNDTKERSYQDPLCITLTVGKNTYYRLEPSDNSKILGSWPEGAHITAREEKGDWWRTSAGWIKKEDTREYPICKELIVSREANYYSDSSESSSALGKWKKGDAITAIDETNNWWQTRVGWIRKNDVIEKGYEYPLCIELFVTRDSQYRKGPGENYAVVGSWSKGAAITAIDEKDGWWQTRVGWIKKNDTKERTYAYSYCITLTVLRNSEYRESPSEQSKVLGKWLEGAHITAREELGDWWKTSAGWIKKSDTIEYPISKQIITTRKASYKTMPSEESVVNGTLARGLSLVAIDQTDGWWKTSAGWIRKNDTKDINDTNALNVKLVAYRNTEIRQEANSTGKIVSSIVEGTKITAIDQTDGWWKTTTGWVSKNDTKEIPISRQLVGTRTGNYRSGAGEAYSIVGTIKPGDDITAVAETINWYSTSLGWVKKNDTKDKSSGYPLCIELFVTRDSQYRKGPGENYAVVGSWSKGAAITAIDEKDGWWQTSAGWVKKNDTKERYDTNSLNVKLVAYRNAAIRQEANSTGKIVSSIVEGTKITAIDQTDGWWKTTTGWVSKNDTKEIPISRQLVGTRTGNYRSGAGEAYSIVGTIKPGDDITAVAETINWYSTSLGWVKKNDTKDKSSGYPLCIELFVTRDSQYRKGPGENYAVVGSWSKGAAITAIDEKDGWWQTSVGWVKKNDTKERYDTNVLCMKMIVINNSFYKENPSDSSKTIGVINVGNSITVIDQSGEWWKTSLGWVKKSDVKESY